VGSGDICEDWERRRRKVKEGGEGDGWGGGEGRENFGDWCGEHSAPVSDHHSVSSGDAESSLIVVGEVVGAFLVVFPSVF